MAGRTPVLSTVARAAYSAYQHTALRVVSSEPAVRSVHLMGSMVSKDLVPGISDVDLIVVVASDPAGELATLRRWRRIFKVLAPMAESVIGHHLIVLGNEDWRYLQPLFQHRKKNALKALFNSGTSAPSSKVTLHPSVLQLDDAYHAHWLLVRSLSDIRRAQHWGLGAKRYRVAACRTLDKAARLIRRSIGERSNGQPTDLYTQAVSCEDNRAPSSKNSTDEFTSRWIYWLNCLHQMVGISRKKEPVVVSCNARPPRPVQADLVRRWASQISVPVWRIAKSNVQYIVFDAPELPVVSCADLLRMTIPDKNTDLRLFTRSGFNAIHMNSAEIEAIAEPLQGGTTEIWNGWHDSDRVLLDSMNCLIRWRGVAVNGDAEQYADMLSLMEKLAQRPRAKSNDESTRVSDDTALSHPRRFFSLAASAETLRSQVHDQLHRSHI